MLELLYNLGLSTAITASALFVRSKINKFSSLTYLETKCEDKPDSKTEDLAMKLQKPFINFLKREDIERLSDEGARVNEIELISTLVKRKMGVSKRDFYKENASRKKSYPVIINYSNAVQDASGPSQKYVTLLTKSLASIVKNLEFDLAINAIGKNTTIVKRFQDPLDLSLIDNLHVSPSLNLYQGVDYINQLGLVSGKNPPIQFYILNAQSSITDNSYHIQNNYRKNSILLVYSLSSNCSLQNLDRLKPRSKNLEYYSGSYHVHGIADLVSTFEHFLKKACK